MNPLIRASTVYFPVVEKKIQKNGGFFFAETGKVKEPYRVHIITKQEGGRFFLV